MMIEGETARPDDNACVLMNSWQEHRDVKPDGDHATRMLAGSEQPPGQISTDLGLAAPSSVTRFPKERVEFAPSNLRRHFGDVAM